MAPHSHLILDEVHERSMEIDLLLTKVRRIVRVRRTKGLSNPKIVLVSATIDVDLFAKHFSHSERNELPVQVVSLNVPGRAIPVTAQYLGDSMRTLIRTYNEAQLGSLLHDSKYGEDTRTFLDIEHSLALNVKPKLRSRRRRSHLSSQSYCCRCRTHRWRLDGETGGDRGEQEDRFGQVTRSSPLRNTRRWWLRSSPSVAKSSVASSTPTGVVVHV